MPEFTATAAYPAFTGDTAKRDLLRALRTEIEPNCPNTMSILARINNSDLSALTAGATVYDTDGNFESSV